MLELSGTEVALTSGEILFPVGRRIFRGVRRLDVVPGLVWRPMINKEKLDMFNFRCCILAQIFGDYAKGCRELRIHMVGPEPFLLGFSVLDASNPLASRYYSALRRGWLEAVDMSPAMLPTLLEHKIAA